MSATIFTYVFMGLFAGYFSGRMYKTIKGNRWKSTAALVGVFYPALMLGITFFLNLFLWGIGSSAGPPFGTFMALLSLWTLVSLPLVIFGFFFGFRKRPYEQPVRTNQIPRAVPVQPFKQNILVTSLLAGAMPFGAMSIELFFIMSAIWNRQIYYLFGFLFIVFLIYAISCAEIAVVLTYFQLCNENYHWWWRALISSGGAALYVFGYTIYYFVTQLNISGAIPVVIYLGHSLIMSVTIWLLSATIGFYGVFFFLRKIYAVIKID
ncbi:hypothetical protein Ciccas_005454 [Cichlidogyrus casuarinus]|uniref:Transmembrane 9 superfamily member n=1 Tax=Cichlidogyrus casuarinus TaxID=1844966 RepID=A0ABD2Q8L6_9PLAT